MFEDEGSLRRRPRGFRRKQQIKAYSSSGPYYSPSGYESTPITVGDLPSCYSTSPYTSYEYGTAAPAAPTGFSDSGWVYSSEYASKPAQSPSHTANTILDYGSNYQYNTSSYAIDNNGKFNFFINSLLYIWFVNDPY